MKNLKTLILSPGNSGGGAVFEYLASRKDFVSPFRNEEFRMVGDPDGLFNLYLECVLSTSAGRVQIASTIFFNNLDSLNMFALENTLSKICIFET